MQGKMKSQKTTSMAPMKTLPMEIITEEILPRLPTKSLLRFKCVSKLWQCLISSPEFSNLHLRLSPRSDSECLLIFPNETSTNEFYIQDVNSSSRHVATLDLHRQCNERTFIVNSCNGLLCMEFAQPNELVVINPLTRCFRIIPFDSKMYQGSFHGGVGSIGCQKIGFGYDSAVADYKIVRIVHYSVSIPTPTVGNVTTYAAHFKMVPPEVAIYSLKNDSWKMVESIVPSWDNRLVGGTTTAGAVVGNNLVHWSVTKFRRGLCILCFDLTSENWTDNVPLPDSYTKLELSYNGMEFHNLRVLDGCLCLSTKIHNYSKCDPEMKGFNVWIMKEYGVKDSWVKLLHLSTNGHDAICPPIIIFPVANRRGSRESQILLLQETYSEPTLDYTKKLDAKLVWYNSSDKSLKKADDTSGLSGKSKVCLHMASLVNVSESKRPRKSVMFHAGWNFYT